MSPANTSFLDIKHSASSFFLFTFVLLSFFFFLFPTALPLQSLNCQDLNFCRIHSYFNLLSDSAAIKLTGI